MNTLVVYFSFSGNNRRLAEHLAGRLGCDVCPIVERKRRTVITIILDMALKREPAIEPLARPIAGYRHVVVAGPVWGASVASPVRALLRRERTALMSYSFATLCGYEGPGQEARLEQELTGLVGRPPRAVLELRISDLFPEETRGETTAIARYRVTAKDLDTYEPRIAGFVARLRATGGA